MKIPKNVYDYLVGRSGEIASRFIDEILDEIAAVGEVIKTAENIAGDYWKALAALQGK